MEERFTRLSNYYQLRMLGGEFLLLRHTAKKCWIPRTRDERHLYFLRANKRGFLFFYKLIKESTMSFTFYLGTAPESCHFEEIVSSLVKLKFYERITIISSTLKKTLSGAPQSHQTEEEKAMHR